MVEYLASAAADISRVARAVFIGAARFSLERVLLLKQVGIFKLDLNVDHLGHLVDSSLKLERGGQDLEV